MGTSIANSHAPGCTPYIIRGVKCRVTRRQGAIGWVIVRSAFPIPTRLGTESRTWAEFGPFNPVIAYETANSARAREDASLPSPFAHYLFVPFSSLFLYLSLIFSAFRVPFSLSLSLAACLFSLLSLARFVRFIGITWRTCMHACMHACRMHPCMHAFRRSEDGSTLPVQAGVSGFLPLLRGEENRSSLKSCPTG